MRSNFRRGSGLLSHFTHTVRPDARVIYNDFDNYTVRLAAIPATNAILAELRTILSDYPRNKRIVEPYRTRILDAIARYDRTDFVDYISLSASILFSSNYVTNLAALRKEHLYNTVRLGDFNADGYLDGLTITHKDYRDLFAEYVNAPHVCFLIDPPYLSTQTLTYEGYWHLSDYLDVLHTLNGTNYFYFTSDKSSIVELCAWLDREHRLANPFCGATRIEQTTNLNYNSHYTDIRGPHKPVGVVGCHLCSTGTSMPIATPKTTFNPLLTDKPPHSYEQVLFHALHNHVRG